MTNEANEQRTTKRIDHETKRTGVLLLIPTPRTPAFLSTISDRKHDPGCDIRCRIAPNRANNAQSDLMAADTTESIDHGTASGRPWYSDHDDCIYGAQTVDHETGPGRVRVLVCGDPDCINPNHVEEL